MFDTNVPKKCTNSTIKNNSYLSNKNKENMLLDGIFEKKEENSVFILKKNIFLAPHLLNTYAHSYILLPITMEQS